MVIVIFSDIRPIAGWFATDYLGNKARQEIVGESQAASINPVPLCILYITHIKRAAKSLAVSPWIVPALMSKRDQDIEP